MQSEAVAPRPAAPRRPAGCQRGAMALAPGTRTSQPVARFGIRAGRGRRRHTGAGNAYSSSRSAYGGVPPGEWWAVVSVVSGGGRVVWVAWGGRRWRAGAWRGVPGRGRRQAALAPRARGVASGAASGGSPARDARARVRARHGGSVTVTRGCRGCRAGQRPGRRAVRVARPGGAPGEEKSAQYLLQSSDQNRCKPTKIEMAGCEGSGKIS